MEFPYGETELAYLSKRDPQLKEVIDALGYIPREINPDLFTSVVESIVGQQISMAAQATILKRLRETFPVLDAGTLAAAPPQSLQNLGISGRKTEYIQDFSKKIVSGELDPETLCHLPDEEIIRTLTSLRGIGVWTAEMILIFCLERPDVVSFGDLAILRGMRMLYHHRKITDQLFYKYKRRYSPYGSVASFYLWAVATGHMPGLKDYAPKTRR